MKSTDSKIRNSWNWLPSFRAVAEAEHLPTASKRIHLTAAALSRTVKLLEDELGRPLFHRRGRRLHLNQEGQVLLQAVRQAMHTLEEAHDSLTGRRLEGPIRVASGGVSRVFVQPAVLSLRDDLPDMIPFLLTPDPTTALLELERGDLDLVVGSFVLGGDSIQSEHLGDFRSSVYCGRRSPFFGKTVTMTDVIGSAFVAPPPNAAGISQDGWPSELERTIRYVVDRLETGMNTCEQTDLLAVIPDALASRSGAELWRLDLGSILPVTPIIATYRTPSGPAGMVEEVLIRLREATAMLRDPSP